MHNMHDMPENDHEAAMARADLYKLAQYSAKLSQMIPEGQQLEGRVQAKITKAADYVSSVYHFMAYEMKVSEYGEALENAEVYESELREKLQQRLLEAKEKVKELKKVDALKHKAHKSDKELEEMRRMTKEDEEKSSTGGTIDRSKKGVTRHKQNPDRFSDEPHTEPPSQAKSKSAAEKAGEKAMDKAEEKEGKNWEKRFGKGSVTRVKDGKKVSEASKKGDGNLANNAKPYDKVTRGDVIAGRLGKDEMGGKKKTESLKGGQVKLDKNKNGKLDGDDFAKLRANKGVKETAISGAPQKSGIPATAKTTVPGMRATQQDLKKANSSAALGEGRCNKTPKGKACPVHGLKECGPMGEARSAKQQAAIAIAKKKAK